MTPDDGEAPKSQKLPRELRLPGSVAEIMASPPGSKIGAFFDLDGTLVAGFTAVILTQERIRRRDMGVGEMISMITAGLNHQLGRIEFEELIGKASSALRGRMLSDLEEIGERLFAQKIESRIYPEMRELVRAHLARGHTVVLSSSALTIQVAPVAKFPRHHQHAHQQVRDRRRRGSHRRCGQADSVGAGQGLRGAEVRRRQRHRPEGQLLLRRRRRRRRADVSGRQSASDQPGRQDGRRRQAAWLAHPAVHQSQRRWNRRAAAHACRRRLGGSRRRRRARDRTADPQQAPRCQLLHRDLVAAVVDRQRRSAQHPGRGESDRAAARGVHLQPPQPGRPDHRRAR